jgi:hypothetical protein
MGKPRSLREAERESIRRRRKSLKVRGKEIGGGRRRGTGKGNKKRKEKKGCFRGRGRKKIKP